MQILQINKENIDKAVAYLKQGGVVIHPTDTCYGLAADITNKVAVEKIYLLKQMSPSKPMSIIVSDLSMLKIYAFLSQKAAEIAKKYLPGALTLILPKTKSVPSFYAKSLNFLGVRIPKNFLSLELVQKLDSPITTTSANITKKLPAYTPQDVENYFGNADVLFLNGGILPNKKPSTILKFVDDSFEIIRQGDLII